MRKTSFGLGLAGGILAIIQGISGLVSILFMDLLDFPFGKVSEIFDHFGFKFDGFLNFGDRFWLLMIPSIIALIAAGILGIIGSTHISKNSKTAGVLMLVGGGLCVIGNFHTFVAGLLIAAGILALITTKSKPKQPTIEQ